MQLFSEMFLAFCAFMWAGNKFTRYLDTTDSGHIKSMLFFIIVGWYFLIAAIGHVA